MRIVFIQNGVEIDFIVEKKNTLYFIEAKAGERADKARVNFDKVIPLFSKKFKTEAILAQKILNPGIIKYDKYICVNPVENEIVI